MAKNRIKILVIDDLQDNLIILNALIKDAFPEAITLNALNGKKGLELAVKEDPDVILLDIIMPEMDGYEVCKKLKADKKSYDIPVIFVTAIDNTKEGLIRALECGGEAFLTKPVDEIELIAQIRAMLKVRNANIQKRDEKEQLAELVEEKTSELNKAYVSTLNLLEDLKKENEARTKSEVRYRTLLQNLEAGIVVHAPDTSIVMNNPRASELLGLTNDQMSGKMAIDPSWKFVKEDNTPLPLDGYPVNRIVNFKKPLKDQILGIYQPGKNDIVWVIVNGFPILNKTGKITEIVISFFEITMRKRAEKALKESEEQNRSITQTAADAIVSINSEGIISSWNIAAEKIFGYSSSEMINEDLTKIIPVHHIVGHNAGIQNLRDGGKEKLKRKTIELTGLRKDRTEFPVELSLSSWKSDNQKYYTGIIRDITERKQAEKDLLLNKKRQDALLNLNQMSSSSLESIYSYTLDAAVELTESKLGFLGFVNEDYSKVSIFNWSGAAMKECNVKDFNVEFEVEKAGIWGEVVRTGKPIMINDFDAPNPLKKGIPNGHVKLENYLSIPVYSNMKVVAIVAVANKEIDYIDSDIKQLTLLLDGMWKFTQQHNDQSALKNALEKATESDRLKTAFINNISHEIRTPLNGILGFAPFIIQPDCSFEEKEMYLNILNVSSDRLMNTVTSYMDISLIASGNMGVHSELVDLSSIMKEVYEHFKNQCLEKNLELIINLPEKENQFILNTDKELVLKIASHLVDNAIKFTTRGSVELGYNISAEVENHEIELYIKDTGLGIALDAQIRIFDAFMQENIANTRGHEGCGLGLSIAKGLTELLGGEFRLESEQNKGTTVFVTFPLEKSHLPKQEKVDTPKNSNEKLRTILIAEDDELNFSFLETILKVHSSKLLKAINGQEAVDLCRKRPEIDLVLMDIKMPVMGGLEATRQIKLFRKDLPIIAITAFALSGDENRFKEAGCDDYISKPVNKEKLLDLITKYV